MFENILMVCDGNLCRSPMAKVLLEHELHSDSNKVSIDSAGISAFPNLSADVLAQQIMEERGLDLSTHRSKKVTKALILSADIIFVMETRQRKQIEYIFPYVRGRVHCLGRWENIEIIDPYQKQKANFEQSLSLIAQGIESWKCKFWKSHV